MGKDWWCFGLRNFPIVWMSGGNTDLFLWPQWAVLLGPACDRDCQTAGSPPRCARLDGYGTTPWWALTDRSCDLEWKYLPIRVIHTCISWHDCCRLEQKKGDNVMASKQETIYQSENAFCGRMMIQCMFSYRVDSARMLKLQCHVILRYVQSSLKPHYLHQDFESQSVRRACLGGLFAQRRWT